MGKYSIKHRTRKNRTVRRKSDGGMAGPRRNYGGKKSSCGTHRSMHQGGKKAHRGTRRRTRDGGMGYNMQPMMERGYYNMGQGMNRMSRGMHGMRSGMGRGMDRMGRGMNSMGSRMYSGMGSMGVGMRRRMGYGGKKNMTRRHRNTGGRRIKFKKNH